MSRLITLLSLVLGGSHALTFANGSNSPIPDDAKANLKPGAECKFEIADKVNMVFCWIPAGETQLGSPKAEQDYVSKTFLENVQTDWLDAERESLRGKFKSKGFWLGKFEVTQGEWKALMGDNPSRFKPDGAGKNILQEDEILDTTRFPVEQVSWNDCQKFLDKLNKKNDVAQVFGKAGKFVLPHEDEWEYACRGGKANKQPFYWGNELNGNQANCDGTIPYRTETKGSFLDRTCAVDDTHGGKYEKHPWGLCHMLGNVIEICENVDKNSSVVPVLRGGSWWNSAFNCRSARRDISEPHECSLMAGFRVCFRPEK